MKITKEHFGKKLRRSSWLNTSYFIPLGFNQSKTLVIGEDTGGNCDVWAYNHEDWVLFEEPKKKVIKPKAPAVYRQAITANEFTTSRLYESWREAKEDLQERFVKWPASENMFVEIEVEE